MLTYLNTFKFSHIISWIFILINSHSGGWSPNGSTRHVGHWMAYCTCPGWLWWWKDWWNEDWQGKPKYSEKTRPSATLSTTNPTLPDPSANPGHRGGKPATNRLSYGAARIFILILASLLRQRYRSGFFSLRPSNRNFLRIWIIPIRASCHIHIIFLDLLTLFVEKYKLWSS
jgi:hypothetical protein